MNEKTALTYAITRALAYKENGGKPNLNNLKAGKTGEMKSIFQFTPDTWKKDAQEVLGDSNAQMTPDNETEVVTSKVSQWIDKGYTAKQIASMWNAGIGEPNAYTGKFSDGTSSKGVNKKYNVNFDVSKYANDVANYAKKFYQEDLSKQITTQTSPTLLESKNNIPQTSSQNGLIGGLTPSPLVGLVASPGVPG